LAAADDVKGKTSSTGQGLQTGKSTIKGSIFSRLGDPVTGDSAKEKQATSLKLQQEAKQKYSPRQVILIDSLKSVYLIELCILE